MNKIISANINGFVFSIDEAAYDKLRAYLEDIRKKVNNFEVMTDIENRIAELFDYKLKNGKPAILEEDVNEIIGQIGSPDQFGQEEETAESTQKSATSSGSRKKYRRLYRNEDDKIIGGVCSGIAAYFNIDPMFIRLAFGASFFMLGTGFLLYIFLMVILPKAMTPSEKLEMMGEPVDFKNLSKTIEKDFKEAYDRYKPDMKTGFERFAEVAVKVGAVILLLFLVSIFIPTGIGIFASIGVATWSLPVLSSYMFTTFSDTIVLLLGMILFFIIPIIGAGYKLIRIIFKTRPMHKAISISLSIVWLLGFCMLAYSTYNIGSQFSTSHKLNEIDTIKVEKNQTLVIRSTGEQDETRFYRKDDDGDEHINIHSRDDLKAFLDQKISENVELTIARGFSKYPVLKVIRKSLGEDRKNAYGNAERIEYHYDFNDSILNLSGYFSMGNDQLWRNQRVKLILEIPEGQKFIIDSTCEDLLSGRDFHDWDEDDEESIYGSNLRINNKGVITAW